MYRQKGKQDTHQACILIRAGWYQVPATPRGRWPLHPGPEPALSCSCEGRPSSKTGSRIPELKANECPHMGICRGLCILPGFPSVLRLQLGFPKANDDSLGKGQSLFSTHVCSAIWGSMGLGESMQRPEGTECFSLKVVPFPAPFPPLCSNPIQRRGEENQFLFQIMTHSKVKKNPPSHGPQGLSTNPQMPRGPLPIYYGNASTWFVNQNFAKHFS